MAEKEKQAELAESLSDLFSSISTMIKSELQGTTNHMELLEKMNLRVAEEYKGFGDVASGLSIFVEQLKSKSGYFDEYVKQIDVIDQQVTEFEAVVSVLDKHVTMSPKSNMCIMIHRLLLSVVHALCLVSLKFVLRDNARDFRAISKVPKKKEKKKKQESTTFRDMGSREEEKTTSLYN
ncbi:hypothetical protein ACLB2K_073984 [Fragaria x ananassa]